MMLEDVRLSLNLLKIFVQHCATSLAQQCCTVLASFEQALTVDVCLFLMCKIVNTSYMHTFCFVENTKYIHLVK